MTPYDLAAFAQFRIPSEVLASAGVQRVTDDEARSRYGLTYKGRCDGILFPYYSPTTGHRVTCRLRRDAPEVDEEGHPIAKYVAPFGDQHHLYFAPGSETRLGDCATSVIAVEAEKSALALTALAARVGQPWLVIALGGCWGWRGKRGLVETPDGGKVEERGPLPDLDLVSWTGREAILLFDANVTTNSKVRAARRALARELEKRGARVRLADLPVEEGVNGPDDYLARHDDQAVLTVLRSTREATETNCERQTRRSQATALVDLADGAGAEFFSSPDGTPYVSLETKGHRETYPIKSRYVRDWLAMLAYREGGSVPGATAVADALTTLAGRARWDGGEVIPVHVRVAHRDTGLYIDLGTATWEVVHVDATGWRVVRESPVRFRRPFGLEALPMPTRGGEITWLRPFVNVGSDADFQLLVAWLVAAYRGEGPYPVLALNGEQGSAKSTTAEVLRGVVDPNTTPLRAVPRDERDLFIQANNSHVLVLDNISVLSDWLSDALCRLASGSGFSTRALFTDSDEQLFSGARPLVLNGIEDVVRRGDLLDRLIAITAPVIPEQHRVDERRLRRDYNQARPAILGALLTGLGTAIARLPEVHLDRMPRMADFALWTAASEVAFGWTNTVTVYMENRQLNVLGGQLKTGNLWTAQNRQFRRAAETPEFYFVPSSGRKSVWSLVRQLRGPHLSTCA